MCADGAAHKERKKGAVHAYHVQLSKSEHRLWGTIIYFSWKALCEPGFRMRQLHLRTQNKPDTKKFLDCKKKSKMNIFLLGFCSKTSMGNAQMKEEATRNGYEFRRCAAQRHFPEPGERKKGRWVGKQGSRHKTNQRLHNLQQWILAACNNTPLQGQKQLTISSLTRLARPETSS